MRAGAQRDRGDEGDQPLRLKLYRGGCAEHVGGILVDGADDHGSNNGLRRSCGRRVVEKAFQDDVGATGGRFPRQLATVDVAGADTELAVKVDVGGDEVERQVAFRGVAITHHANRVAQASP